VITKTNSLTHEKYDRLWKITIFQVLSDACAKYYSTKEYLAANKVTVFQRLVHFQTVYTKET
jgi:hypothetical protein